MELPIHGDKEAALVLQTQDSLFYFHIQFIIEM